MNEEDQIDKEEAQFYPRLLLLDEFGGEIDGRLKYHKSLFMYRNEVMDLEDWPFSSETRGPMDEGFTSVMDDYEKLDLVEIDEDGNMYVYSATEKGKRFVSGVKRGLSKIREGTQDREDAASLIGVLNRNRSGSEIETDEPVQEAKESPYQDDV